VWIAGPDEPCPTPGSHAGRAVPLFVRETEAAFFAVGLPVGDAQAQNVNAPAVCRHSRISSHGLGLQASAAARAESVSAAMLRQ
jgi:hypothetical protein